MIDHVLAYTLPAAYSLLPKALASPEATAMLLAIGCQESGFQFRRQMGGPAKSFWQFEANGGTRGVLEHPITRTTIRYVLRELQYDIHEAGLIHQALEHNDTLAACFARCLLWTVPEPLPGPNDWQSGWDQYMEAWRPGKPHKEAWPVNFSIAWGAVLKGRQIPPEMIV